MKRRVKRALKRKAPKRFSASKGPSALNSAIHKVLTECILERRLQTRLRIDQYRPIPSNVLCLPLLHLFSPITSGYGANLLSEFDQETIQAMIKTAEKEDGLKMINRFASKQEVIQASFDHVLSKYPGFTTNIMAVCGPNELISVDFEAMEEQSELIGWALNTYWWNAIASLTGSAESVMSLSFLDEIDAMKEHLYAEEQDEASDSLYIQDLKKEYWNDADLCKKLFDSTKGRLQFPSHVLKKNKLLSLWLEDALILQKDLENAPQVEESQRDLLEQAGIGLYEDPVYDQAFIHRVYLGVSDDILMESCQSHVNEVVGNFSILKGYQRLKMNTNERGFLSMDFSETIHQEEQRQSLRKRYVELVSKARMMHFHENDHT